MRSPNISRRRRDDLHGGFRIQQKVRAPGFLRGRESAGDRPSQARRNDQRTFPIVPQFGDAGTGGVPAGARKFNDNHDQGHKPTVSSFRNKLERKRAPDNPQYGGGKQKMILANVIRRIHVCCP